MSMRVGTKHTHDIPKFSLNARKEYFWMFTALFFFSFFLLNKKCMKSNLLRGLDMDDEFRIENTRNTNWRMRKRNPFERLYREKWNTENLSLFEFPMDNNWFENEKIIHCTRMWTTAAAAAAAATAPLSNREYNTGAIRTITWLCTITYNNNEKIGHTDGGVVQWWCMVPFFSLTVTTIATATTIARTLCASVRLLALLYSHQSSST